MFERLRKENPSVLKKIIAIEGDLTVKNLDLSAEQKNRLIDEVEVVINGAASLRLEAGMKAAIESNTLGTLRVLELCKEMKKLKVSEIYTIQSLVVTWSLLVMPVFLINTIITEQRKCSV